MPDSGGPSQLQAGEDFGRMAELVEYQDGAVVSRTVLKSAGGNLTVFAFDQNEGLSEHTTPNEALIWVLEGSVEAVIGDIPHSLNPGDFIRLPAGVPHAIRAPEKMKMALVLFH
jgi:quercetin dioxygenase-like cupin family protein